MPAVTPLLILITLGLGAAAGLLGTLLGIGGGVLLVPFLVMVVGIPFHVAVAVSLTTVIATSSAVSAATTGKGLINLRLGMVLEIATAAGGLAGGLTAHLLSARTLQMLFAMVTGGIGIVTLVRLSRAERVGDGDPGPLGGRYWDERLRDVVTYRVVRLPLAVLASLVAGNVSTLLGIGGGIIKVPVLNAWCGVPMRAAAATSAFMIGVTATSGALIYYGRGDLIPELAAAAVLGVHMGSRGGLRLGARLRPRTLRMFMAIVLFAVSASMAARSL